MENIELLPLVPLPQTVKIWIPMTQLNPTSDSFQTSHMPIIQNYTYVTVHFLGYLSNKGSTFLTNINLIIFEIIQLFSSKLGHCNICNNITSIVKMGYVGIIIMVMRPKKGLPKGIYLDCIYLKFSNLFCLQSKYSC